MSRIRLLATVLVYDRETDQLVREHPLGEADLPALRSVFGLDEEDPMTLSYPIEEAQVLWLARMIPERPDLERYAYFVETHPMA
jgi:hypothetical protein